MKFLLMFCGISETYEKNGNHVLKFMIGGQQVLTLIWANRFSLYWIQQIFIWGNCLQLMVGGQILLNIWWSPHGFDYVLWRVWFQTQFLVEILWK